LNASIPGGPIEVGSSVQTFLWARIVIGEKTQKEMPKRNAGGEEAMRPADARIVGVVVAGEVISHASALRATLEATKEVAGVAGGRKGKEK
jgi:hypothetical protein